MVETKVKWNKLLSIDEKLVMSKFIVTANKLNRRKVIPASLPDLNNIIDVVRKNFIFEAEIVSKQEMPLTVHDKWFRDKEGRFYWGGGLKDLSEISTQPFPAVSAEVLGGIQFDPAKMSWGHKFCNIPFIWSDLETLGKNITVAIIDTGIDETHADLVNNIHPLSKNFIQDGGPISDSDGHGTSMAGIIGATGKNKVFGVAPEVKLLIVKVMQEARGANPKVFAKALDFVSNIPEVDIVSISSSFLTDDQDLRTSIQTCLSANKIIVSAIGNLRDFISIPQGPDHNTFPACYNGVIAVGAFDQSGEVLKNVSCWNEHLSFLAPGDFSVLTTGLNNTTKMGKATSIATAFTSGCLALILSYARQKAIPFKDCVKAILESCDDIGTVIGKDIQSGNGRLNIRNAITKIKKP